MLNVNEAYNCGRCGLCLATCPVYRQERDETVSPRSKVQLARIVAEGGLVQSPQLMKVFSTCINCGNCTAACPAGVLHGPLFMRLRSLLGDQFGHSWTMRLLFHLLTHEQQLLLSAKIARFGRNVILEKLAERPDDREIQAEKYSPHEPAALSGRKCRRHSSGRGCKRDDRVFRGLCDQPDLRLGRRIRRQVLTAMGFRVVIPKDQVCCALPLIMHGALEKALENIVTNIRVLGDPTARQSSWTAPPAGLLSGKSTHRPRRAGP